MEDISEIKEAITWVKECGDEWYTNYYISDIVAKQWIKNGQLKILIGENAAFLLRQKQSFSLLYYFAASDEGLFAGMRALINETTETLSVDVLHKNDDDNKVGKIFRNIGFDKRIKLYRMRKGKSSISKAKLPKVCYAKRDDAEIIETMLSNEFDELCEQIPDIDEIKSAIDNRQIIILEDDNRVISFFWAERTGKTVLWRYWLTDPKYRSSSLAGLVLLRQVMALHEDAMQTFLWVREDNEKVIKAHEKNGFTKDGLVDDVYCLIR
ncbi:MAG: GNAT family N-acetyltransferase [Selenomonadaceae bacterium]|nr:GNAT family N-acetyltransferase [Selenomonadaceae bacterium]